MSWLLENLPPRSFVDFTVPIRVDGSPLLACSQSGDYETYVTWLADYLHSVELPLTLEQRGWLEVKPRSAKKVIFECSDMAGYAVWDLDIIEGYFEEGNGYREYETVMREAWMESTSPEEREEFAYEALSPEAYARLHREWQADKAVGQSWHHADIPFRPLLAWALRQMPDAAVRRKEMDWFFRNFDDNASK